VGAARGDAGDGSGVGFAGVVAAPIYYAYLKDELSARKLI